MASDATHNLTHQLRPLLVGALLVASAAHLPLIPSHASTAYLAALFLTFSGVSGLLAAVIYAQPTRSAYTSAALLCAAAIGAYVASRTVGLPGHPHDVGYWADPLGVVSLAGESVAVGCALVLRQGRRVAVPIRDVRLDVIPLLKELR